MKEITGDIWDFYDQGHWIVIPTNLSHKANGDAVMGAGLAKQAVDRFSSLPFRLGQLGYGVHAFLDLHLYALPTKDNWRNPSSIELIQEGVQNLSESAHWSREIYLPRLGCGERTGRLQWNNVKPIMEQCLDDRFTVVSLLGS